MRKQTLLPLALLLAVLQFSCNKVVKNEAYFQAIAQALQAGEGASRRISWQGPGIDRIY